MREIVLDNQKYLRENYQEGGYNFTRRSWNEFINNWLGFNAGEYNDAYLFLFKFDIRKQDDGNYRLELCFMLQKKRIYLHLDVLNITQNELDSEVKEWLSDRKNIWILCGEK